VRAWLNLTHRAGAFLYVHNQETEGRRYSRRASRESQFIASKVPLFSNQFLQAPTFRCSSTFSFHRMGSQPLHAFSLNGHDSPTQPQCRERPNNQHFLSRESSAGSLPVDKVVEKAVVCAFLADPSRQRSRRASTSSPPRRT
jgi:hypothetical protein